MKSESKVTSDLRIKAGKKNWLLMRNNVGACVDNSGRLIRYGLANDSKLVNRSIKSSDLIGIRPVKITQDMVGQTIGQFVAIEVKKEGWEPKNDDHERAQSRFIELVKRLGGYAKFSTGGL